MTDAANPLDILGPCQVRRAGVTLPARPRLVIVGPPVADDPVGKRTVATLDSPDNVLEVELGDIETASWWFGSDPFQVGYNAQSGDWFGATAHSEAFSAARTIRVTAPELVLEGGGESIITITGFAADPIERRKYLFNRGPLSLRFLNGFSGTPEDGEVDQAPTTLRVAPTTDDGFVLPPERGVRLVWDETDSRWIVVPGFLKDLTADQLMHDDDPLADEDDGLLLDG